MAWALKEAFPVTNWDASGGTNTTRSAVGTVAVAVGDFITVKVPYRNASNTTITVADNLGNTYTERTTPKFWLTGDSGSGCMFFDCVVTVAGTPTITATAAAACSFFGVFARSYSGIDTTTPYQASVAYNRISSPTTATDACTSSNATIATPPVLVEAYGYQPGPSNGANLSLGTSFSDGQSGRKSNNEADYVRIGSRRVTSAGSVAGTFTNAQAGNTFVGCVLVYSEAITAPTIQGGTANPVHLSTGNTITGVNFGASHAGNVLAIGGVTQTWTAWSATSITYTADRGTNLDDVAVNAVVTPNGVAASDPYALTGFDPPAGYKYVTLTSVNSTADYRITAIADLAIGNQLEWDNALVTIDPDGTYVADPSVTSFNVRVGVTTDGWGSLALQTVGSANDSDTAMNGRAMGLGLKLGRVVYA